MLPADLETFVDDLVPLLHEEGGFPRQYQESTLRERFALPLSPLGPSPYQTHEGALA